MTITLSVIIVWLLIGFVVGGPGPAVGARPPAHRADPDDPHRHRGRGGRRDHHHRHHRRRAHRDHLHRRRAGGGPAGQRVHHARLRPLPRQQPPPTAGLAALVTAAADPPGPAGPRRIFFCFAVLGPHVLFG